MENNADTEVDAAELIGDEADAEPIKLTKKAVTKKSEGMAKRIKIQLEENDDIPPTGLPLGHNGIGYIIRPGEPVEVPEFLLDILDNAVMSAPVIDPQTRRVVGTREKLRFPYRRL